MALAKLNLQDLDGSNGFIIPGIDDNGKLGRSVSNVGDINGDGIDDLILGAPEAGEIITGPYGNDYSNRRGEAYVVFGTTNGFDRELDLTSLNGSNGFTISGTNEYDYLGQSVSNAGDINGDGIDDLILGASNADTGYNSYSNEGEAYVVFGTTDGFDAQLDLTTLDGSNGFIIPGIDENGGLGRSVSNAGDINGDGIDDLILGAPYAGELITGNYRNYSYSDRRGEAYVVFGTNDGFDAELDLTSLDGSNGFTISGVEREDRLGPSVSSAGDINGDGIDDLIIGAPNADTGDYNPYASEGEAYVVFGTNDGFDAQLDLTSLDGSNGFTISGVGSDDNLGSSVSSAGDINGDGINDLIIGAPNADTGDYNSSASKGEAYVVFGTNDGFDAQLDLTSLDGSNGLIISGFKRNDNLGSAVSNAGDFNGDGFDDLLISAPNAGSTNGDYYAIGEGEVYILFGSSNSFDADLDLNALNSDDGLIIRGINTNDRLGRSVSSTGDVNGDGFDDILVSAPYAGTTSSYSREGEAYVIFGFAPVDLIGTANDDVLTGSLGADFLSGLAGNDTMDGNNGIDTIRGNAGNDLLNGGSDSDRLFGQGGNDTLNGESDSDYLVGGKGNDLIDGGEGNDTVIGVEIQGSNLTFGAGNFDTLTGGEGADTFVLGDADNIYYDDGNSFTAGESDFAIITDFEQNQDTIQLNGSAELYSLDFFTSGSGSINAKLIYDPEMSAAGELIAVLEDVSANLTVNDSEFTFI